MENLLKKLNNPSKEYRPVPFWSWNDKLDPERLKWQIREMDKAGIGGYFMHARGGLQTQYLGEDWMNCVRTCIEEGNKYGMQSWCYDEEGWPSGFAGGIVTAMGDPYHVRWLEIEEVIWGEKAYDPKSVLGYYRTQGGQCIKAEEDSLQAGEKITLVTHQSNLYYIDILSEEVIKKFIEVTHEKYYQLFKEEFGKGMPGFFTDEPQFSRFQIPWSYGIPEKFAAKYDYDVTEVLPLLFLNLEGYEKARYDFWALISELFVTSFGKQIYDWCEDHHCQFTGHVMLEESLMAQMGATAGAMPFYEFMHIPGMDWLCRKIDNPIIPKQLGSIASQLGKKFVLSETFALCGWDVSWEELKWIAEWQYVNGVNLMCQHLEGYTLRGLRKRDYPPSLFYQQSWWEEYRQFNDYFARLGVLLTSGKQEVQVLLLHPIKSGWITYDGKNNAAIEQLNQDFAEATEILSGLHIDHHYGDETILQRHGKVDQHGLIVGEQEYKIVVLPSLKGVDRNTLELLNEFIDKGGKVLSIGEFPTLCQGKVAPELTEFKKRVQCIKKDRDLILESMIGMEIPTISVVSEGREVASIHYMQRDLGDQQLFYLVNHSQTETFQTEITLKWGGAVSKYCPEENTMFEIPSTKEEGKTRLELTFLAMESHVLILERGQTVEFQKPETATKVIKPQSKWKVDSMDLNSLTLDYCQYQIDGGVWEGPIPVIGLMDLLLKLKKNVDICLKFNFEIDAELERIHELYLVVEAAEEFEIRLNGSTILYEDIGYWKDSSFKKINIKPFIQNGRNEIILKRGFFQSPKVYEVLFGENILETEKNKLTFDTELESIYIVGDFGVDSKDSFCYGDRKAVFTEGPFVIANQPQEAVSGDLTPQGFCFFAGAIKLSQDLVINDMGGERLLLDIGNPKAVLSKVFVNDQLVKVLPWAPYQVDITQFVKVGDNKLTIELFAGNRNLLGPHHHIDGELYSVGPNSFTDKEGWEGIPGRNIWKDRYCFVKFGLE